MSLTEFPQVLLGSGLWIQETTSLFLINCFPISKQVSFLISYSFNCIQVNSRSDKKHFLTCVYDVKIFSQSPPSVVTGEFSGSARILRLRVSTTERMPPLRLLIMAHPFPPGSTLQFSHPLPSPVYHHRGELEKGVDSPIRLRTNPRETHKPWPALT